MSKSQVPAGWTQITLPAGYLERNGPLHARAEHGKLWLGFRVEHRHCNPADNCHGGMLMTFADMALVLTVRWTNPNTGMIPTVSLSGDFLAAAPVGSWIETSGEVLRATRNMCFVQGVARADGTPILRWSGIGKPVPAGSGPHFDLRKILGA